MRSMTGFGKGLAESDHWSCQIAIRSVNSKFLDIQLKLPTPFLEADPLIRQGIKEALGRGKVELTVTFMPIFDTLSPIVINTAQLKQIRELLVSNGFYRQIEEVPLQDCLALSRDWISQEEINVDAKEIQSLAQQALQEALQHLLAMRDLEGANLKRDIEKRSIGLMTLLSHIESHAEDALSSYRQRLLERMQNLMDDLDIQAAKQRIIEELAIQSDKSDITEEIVRFRSHVVQLKNTLEEKEPIGRKLDFLLQEMNREVNTMGSKSTVDTITSTVVALKCELEKIREQVQNVE